MEAEKLTEQKLLDLGFLKKEGGIGWCSYRKSIFKLVIVPTNKGRIPAFEIGEGNYRYITTVSDLKFLYEFLTRKKLIE